VRQLLSSLPPDAETAVDAVRAGLTHPRTIARLVAREPLDLESLDELVPLMPADGYAVLLDALAASPNRATRRKLLDRIAQANVDISTLVASRLDDERWYVQRNMLLLLERLRRVPPGFSALPWTQHADDRVRYQAIRLQLMIPEEREAALYAALEDSDERIIRVGLLALQEDFDFALVAPVAQLATDQRREDELRVHAVRALAQSRESVALDALLHVVDGGRTILGRPRLAPRSPVVLAALRALAVAWAFNPRAKDVLALAQRSADPDIRQAAEAARS
jgi:hypothetical protein